MVVEPSDGIWATSHCVWDTPSCGLELRLTQTSCELFFCKELHMPMLEILSASSSPIGTHNNSHLRQLVRKCSLNKQCFVWGDMCVFAMYVDA